MVVAVVVVVARKLWGSRRMAQVVHGCGGGDQTRWEDMHEQHTHNSNMHEGTNLGVVRSEVR